jgi:iron complex outermembrane receptor protein
MRAAHSKGYTGVILLLALGAGSAAAQKLPGEVILFGEEEFTIQAATKTEIPLSEAPGSVTVVTARQIRESGARTIPEALRMVAGVNVRWNPMVQTVDMRSFGQNPFTSRVLLLIDGVPYNSWNKGGFPQHPGFDFFVLQNVKRIEVVRGPGSSLYGENAFWGVINIVTLSGEDLEGGRVEVFGGDLETRSVGVVAGKKLGEGSLLVSAKTLESQFPMAFWFAENDAAVEGTDIFVKGRYKGFQASVYRHEDSADGFSEPVEIPGLPPGAFRSIEKIEQTVDIFALKFEHQWENRQVSFSGDLSYARRKGAHCAGCHASTQREEFTHTDENHGNQLIADLRLGFDRVPGHKILVGVEARRISAGDHSDELLDVETPGAEVVLEYTKVAAYVQDQIELAGGRTRLTLGARYDGGTDLFGDEISPRIAALFRASDEVVLRAGWSQAFRFPSFSELYQSSWFFTLDAGAFSVPLSVFQPNPGLEPEKITTWDVGGDYRFSSGLSGKVDLFYSELEDFIVMSFPEVPPGAPVPLIFENHPDDASIWGGEAELRWSYDQVNGFVNWSVQNSDGEDRGVDSSGKPLELVYAPENKLAFGLFLGPFAGFRMGIEAQWRDEVLAPSFWNFISTGDPLAPEAVLDDFTLVHANVSYELPFASGRRSSRLTFYAKNLLDEEPIETLTGVDSHLVGRSFYGGLAVNF